MVVTSTARTFFAFRAEELAKTLLTAEKSLVDGDVNFELCFLEVLNDTLEERECGWQITKREKKVNIVVG